MRCYNRKKYVHSANAYNAMSFNTICAASHLATQNCFTKKSWNNLSIQNKFVLLHRFRGKPWAFSSAGSEHLPYKQRVGGSNPSTPTKPKTRLLKSGLFLFPTPTKNGSVENTGGLKQKHKKQPFSDASASHLSLVLWHVWFQAGAWISHTTSPTPPSYEIGGIGKRIKTARLRRKTKPGRDVILHVRP